MRVMTILGTRPEIIRLSRIIPKLDMLCDHTLVHTGQNYDPNLSDVFFNELGLRQPDHHLGVKADTFGGQAAQIMEQADKVMRHVEPDRVLILGDTNSGLAAIVAKRMGIPVYHLEAGNRCYDDRVPEEVNRTVIDHCSDVLMPYTERSRANLLREGFAGQRVYVVGNPMREVMEHYKPDIARSSVLGRLQVKPRHYVLATVHRSETVDNKSRLRKVVESFERLSGQYGLPVVCSLHPHTKQRMQDFGVEYNAACVTLLDPVGFFDFIALQKHAFCVVSDSGTVPEECCILGVPSVSLRDVTERPEMFEAGGCMLAGVEPENVCRAVDVVTGSGNRWTPPPEYMRMNVSDAVANIVLGV